MKKQSPSQQVQSLLIVGISLAAVGTCLVAILGEHPHIFLRVLQLGLSFAGVCFVFAGLAVLRKEQQ
jgi:VIT1/CCC1 family predicted Fe2+/Mn2+ transporter